MPKTRRTTSEYSADTANPDGDAPDGAEVRKPYRRPVIGADEQARCEAGRVIRQRGKRSLHHGVEAGYSAGCHGAACIVAHTKAVQQRPNTAASRRQNSAIRNVSLRLLSERHPDLHNSPSARSSAPARTPFC